MRDVRRARRFGLVAAVAAMMALAAGCGSSDESASSGDGGGGGDASGDPIKLAFLWEVKGESSYAIQDMQEGALIAVEQVNSSGGIDGRKIEWQRYPASPTDASQAIGQYLKSMEWDPAVTLGPPGPIQQVLTKNVDRTKVPNMPTSPDVLSEYGEKFGSKYRFFGGASMETMGRAAVWYAVEKLGAEKIGLLYSTDPSDTGAMKAIKADLAERGMELAAERSFAIDATDLTKQTLAMKGMDAVLLFAYENPAALAVNQLAQQGINVPVIGYTNLYPAFAAGLIDDAALKNIIGGTPCNLYGDDIAPETQEFIEKYKAATGDLATFQAANAHDSVLIAAEAVAKAGTDDGDAIVEVLETETFEGGACGTHKSNDRHQMTTGVYMHEFKTGEPVLVAEYQDPAS